MGLFIFEVELMEDNISRAFPEKSSSFHKKIAKSSLFHFSLTVLEFLRARDGLLASNVVFENAHIIKDAHAKGKGVFILSLHMSNWEALCCALSKHLAPTLPIVKKIGLEAMNNFVTERREYNGFFSLKREKKGDIIREISKHIKKGDMIGFMMDQSKPGEPEIEFFGDLAKTNTSLAVFWRKYKVPIIPVHIKRIGVGKFLVKAEQELEFQHTEDRVQDTLKNTRYVNQVLEKIILSNPEQYFWLHNRWK